MEMGCLLHFLKDRPFLRFLEILYPWLMLGLESSSETLTVEMGSFSV